MSRIWLRYGVCLALAGASVLTLTACERAAHRRGAEGGAEGGAPMKALARLDCPDTQGGLTRKAASADGRSCDYMGADGAVVALSLNALNSREPDAVLEPLGAELRAELPAPSASLAAKAGSDEQDKQHRNEKDEKVDIDLPGVHIHANGDHASVDAGPHDGKSGVRVNADDNGAEVHVDDRSGSGIRKLMILSADRPGPHGYAVAGYEAHGPAGGPLVVAAIRARDHDHNHDALMRDVDELIKRNAGG